MSTVSSFLSTAGYVLGAVRELTRYALRFLWAMLLPNAKLAARVLGQIARNLLMACEDVAISPGFVVHDRDKLLIWDFDAVLTRAQTKVVKTPFRAPDADANAERWVRGVTEECLDHLILFGLGSLQRALRIYRDFFNGHRPHQGIDNRIPERQATGEPDQTRGRREGELMVECEQFLGGLLNPYYREAA